MAFHKFFCLTEGHRTVLAAVLLLSAPVTGRAEPADAGVPDAVPQSGDARSALPAVIDPRVTLLEEQARHISDLVAGQLDATLDPGTLFDVALADEQAIHLEVLRLEAVLAQLDRTSRAEQLPAPAAGGDAGSPAGQLPSHPGAAEGRAPVVRDAGPPLTDAEIEPDPLAVAPAFLAARLALDRARLAFYGLPPARRAELLEAHRRQQAEVAARLAPVQPSEAELRAKQAEAERERALEAARRARTEAERLVAEELARLLSVERTLVELGPRLDRQREQVAARRDATLGWVRRAKESMDGRTAPEVVDRLYDDLRRSLRAARDLLGRSLDERASAATEVPDAGSDPLASLQADVDTREARATRARVEAETLRLRRAETELRLEGSSQLLDEVDTLNRERLALLPHLSSDKRAAIQGFGAAGFDQAAAELRHLLLVLRYHQQATLDWLRGSGPEGPGHALDLAATAFVLLAWALTLVAFLWWRRRAATLIDGWLERIRQQDRRRRLPAPSLPDRMLGFFGKIRKPLEWVLLFAVLAWPLPERAGALLEVQLLGVVLSWILWGAVVVSVVDALAGQPQRLTGAEDSSALRLRSLRLIGRIVIAFGLVLAVASRLVGHGTIYEWVLTFSLFAILPVFLVLLRWWRDSIFAIMAMRRRPTAVEAWLLRNQRGWKSFLAVTIGGIYLFVSGAVHRTRHWVSRFDTTRRALAYVFRRQLSQRGSANAAAEATLAPLPPEVYAMIGPDASATGWIETGLDHRLGKLQERILARRGGVVALVAERGMGKSTALRRLRDAVPGTLLVEESARGRDGAARALLDAVGLPEATTLAGIAARLDGEEAPPALLLDGAERLIRPVMGGLRSFDALAATARAHCAHCCWVLAIDASVWAFFERSRGAHPAFDEVIHLDPWSEQAISRLLSTRSTAAGLQPSFERLLDELPAGADEEERAEALAERERGYHRLLWDHAGGNPGVALHAWRTTLGLTEDGQAVVRLLQTPDGRELDRLRDAVAFVLRAALQVAPARLDELRQATRLPEAEVADALRYGRAHGILEEAGEGLRVSWTWFRPLTRYLQRKHLVVGQ